MRTLILLMLLSGASAAVAQKSKEEDKKEGNSESVPTTESRPRPSLPMPGAAIPASLILLMLACRRVIRL